MCSIMGFYGKTISQDKFSEGFEKTVSRGPDMSRVISVDSGILGFHRLSIMGLDESGMQPFTLDGDYAVCNGELYGFRKLKKELDKDGFIVIAGKVPKGYFEKRWFGYNAKEA